MNYVLGGGVVALVIGVLTLKAKVKKAYAEAEQANADAEKSKAEAETVRIDNAENATRILVENIVKPLKDELNETRKDFLATKREMARLRKAIDNANSCKHREHCPVLGGMRDAQKHVRKEGGALRQPGQPGTRDSPEGCQDGGDSGECGDADDTGRQPP